MKRLLLVAGIVLLVWFARFVWDYFDHSSIAHQAIQVHLKLFAEAIYEYHATTGQWPSSVDDLGRTSLPKRSHVWRETAASLVILWPKALKPDPKANANVLLAYASGGLFNDLGRVWVCWGDLRTEHLPEAELHARLGQR